MKNKKTVDVVICAYNEDENIERLLKSIISQKGENFYIKKIIVVSDGSTDSTVSKVKSFRNSEIELIEYSQRMGLAARLNEVFLRSKSDVCIKFDGDVILSSDKVISRLVSGFAKGVGLVAGFRIADNPKSFIEKVHKMGDYIWHSTKRNLNNGDNVHNHQGSISAMSHELVTCLRMPQGLYGTDDFVYVKNREAGLGFVFAENAFVYFRNPSTFFDYLLQHRRNLSAKHRLEKYFGDGVLEVYKIPRSYKMRAIVLGFVKSPAYALCYFALELFVRLSLVIKPYVSPRFGWELSKTTKSLV